MLILKSHTVISIILPLTMPPEFELVGFCFEAQLLAWENLQANYVAATFIPQHTESRYRQR